MTTLQRFAQFNSGTPEIPTLQLAETLGRDDTSLTLNNELQISDEELAKCDLLLIAVKHPSGNFENISADPSDYDSATRTISNLTRRVQADGSVVQNDSTIAKQDFPAGSRVVCVVGAQMVNQVQEVLAGERATGKNAFQIGDGTATEQLFKANQGLANNSAYGFDASGNPIIYLANGSSFVPGAGAGTILGGDGIDVTASVISVDLDTNSGLEINSAKLRAKVKAGGGITRDADGLSINKSGLSLADLGSRKFTDLSDTPGSLSGQGGKITRVNAGETALEFVNPPFSLGLDSSTSTFGMVVLPANFLLTAGESITASGMQSVLTFSSGGYAYLPGANPFKEVSIRISFTDGYATNVGLFANPNVIDDTHTSITANGSFWFAKDTSNNLYACYANGTTRTAEKITGITTGNENDYKIIILPSSALFFVNGILQKTLTANFPTSLHYVNYMGIGSPGTGFSIAFYNPLVRFSV